MELDASHIRVNDKHEDDENEDLLDLPTTPQGCKERMETVSRYVAEVGEILVNVCACVFLLSKLFKTYIFIFRVQIPSSKKSTLILASLLPASLFSSASQLISHKTQRTHPSLTLLLPSLLELQPLRSQDLSA